MPPTNAFVAQPRPSTTPTLHPVRETDARDDDEESRQHESDGDPERDLHGPETRFNGSVASHARMSSSTMRQSDESIGSVVMNRSLNR